MKRTGTEADFCARLRAWGEALGFVVYPEVSGWDLVFVSKVDVEVKVPNQGHQVVLAGRQLGIHAKLKANCDLLAQACVSEYGTGPAYRFVAVPRGAGPGFLNVASRLRIGVIEERDEPVVVSHVPSPGNFEPLSLPPIASRALAAGIPNPRTLSQWRVKALRFLAFARAQDGENLTRRDLKAFGLGVEWANEWLVPMGYKYADNDDPRPVTYRRSLQMHAMGEEKERRRGKAVVKIRTYRLTPDAEKLPDFGYEAVAEELWADDAARAAKAAANG